MGKKADDKKTETELSIKQRLKKAAIASMENRPTFDFSSVNRRWQVKYLRANTAIQRAGARAETVAADMNASEQDVDAAFEAFEDEMAARDALVVQVLADVPAEWLVTDAPDEIDWNDPESLGYLRADYNDSFNLALQIALENPAGN